MDHIIIDGFGLVFRAHFAFSALQTTAGIYSGSVYGFLISARTIKKRYPHCHVTIAWDNEAKRRKSIYGSYKANRPRLTISEQISDLKKIFLNLNVSQTDFYGEEADDVIASLVQQYKDQIFIYSSDKDMFQLVKDGHAIVLRPKRGKIPERFFDEEMVKETYSVSPQNFSCFQCFRGDNVDNIPGVPRVRSKLLAYLSEKYKEPTNIYNHLDEEELTEYQRNSLINFKNQALLNYQLVKLRDDLVLDIRTGKPDVEALASILDKYEITSINPNTYIQAFTDTPSFNTRRAPAVQSYSLFEEKIK